MNFRWDIIIEYMPYLLKGTLLTVGFSIGSILLGTILGLLIGLGRTMRNKVLAFPFLVYVTVFRGTPLLVQIFLIHFGAVPLFLGETNAITAGVIALSLNAAAYIAEIFRAGIQSIDRGQMEGARSLGLTHGQSMRYVILPQAFKRMIPPLGNEFIVLLKDSSLLSVIAAPELMYWGRAMGGQYFKVWEPYLASAFIYLILTLVLSYLLNLLERRMKTE
ncbi:amino acid ABC transporter permease [Bacillus massiliglaciei]|uniref:amino acid ABC transporter permease n=1 Tax=Bacillus massiliglaciei TaxID=1816693 RepID=UPI000B1CF0F6|nr:amino acid ABC transporter permease [Bacillus massiliglaciei]